MTGRRSPKNLWDSVFACAPGNPASAKAWHFDYDANGRMIRQTPPDNTTITDLAITEWIYELQGRLDKICEVPAAGNCASASRTVDLTQDALGRTTSEAVTGTGLTGVTTTTAYGVDGQPTSVTSGGATRTLTYETSSGLLDQVKDGSTVLTDYAWSADGTLATRLDNGVGTASFTFDWADRLTSVTPPSGLGYTGSISQAWRLDGLLASTTYGNGETAAIGYDEAKRPDRIDLTGSRWLSRAYDRAGNVTSDDRNFAGGIGSPAGSGELIFTYDGLGRVTNTTLAGSAQASYTYDRSSNRTSKTENGSTFLFTFDATDVLATQKKGNGAVEAFIYDKAGNLTREWTAGATYRTNTWDAANRLTAIAPAAGSAAVLTYDPLGRIATRKVGTDPTTTYGYAGTSDVVVRQAAGSTTSYLATPAGARMGTSTAGTAQWLLYDLLGSVVATAGSGTTTIVDALRYDAYGQTLGLSPAGGSTLGLRFRGLVDLAPTADPDVAGAGTDPLYQMGARAYAPHLGTFTQLDTYAGRAQDPISLNRYLYAHANPTSLIDPSGHAVQKGPCGPDGMACDQGGYNPTDNPQYQNPNAPVIEPKASSGTSSTGGQTAGGSVPPASGPDPWAAAWQSLSSVVGTTGAVAGGIATGLWDFGWAFGEGTVGLANCAVAPRPGIGCAPADLASALLQDWRGTTSAVAFATASGVGDLHRDLNSGDPYRIAHSATTVFANVGLAGAGRAAQLGRLNAVAAPAEGAGALASAGLSDDLVRLANQYVTSSGDTVLGSWPGYIRKASARGASYFDIGDEWGALIGRGDDPWVLNQAFLDGRIAAGDRVLLSIPKYEIGATSTLAREVRYLIDQGYSWVNQWSLRPGG